MANEKVVNNKKITDMLKKMLELGDTLIVDINNAVHFVNTPDEPIHLKSNGVNKRLYIYSTNIEDPEAIILNPLLETITDGAERLLFYSTLSNVLSQWIYRIAYTAIEEGLKQKSSNESESDPKLLYIFSQCVDKLDDKVLSELERIKNAGMKDFCNIYFNRTKKTSTLLFGIEDDSGDYVKSISKVRKKTWEILENVLKAILNVPSDKRIKEIYTSSTEKIECPNFTTYSDVWIKVWSSINPYLDWFSNHHSDPELIESLKEHFNNIPVYRECVTWLKQPTAIKLSSYDAGIDKQKKEVDTQQTTSTPNFINQQPTQQNQMYSWMDTSFNGVNSGLQAASQQNAQTPSWMIGIEPQYPVNSYGVVPSYQNNNYNNYNYGYNNSYTPFNRINAYNTTGFSGYNNNGSLHNCWR